MFAPKLSLGDEAPGERETDEEEVQGERDPSVQCEEAGEGDPMTREVVGETDLAKRDGTDKGD